MARSANGIAFGRVGICVLALALSGCTLLRLAYDNADRMLLERFDSYINFAEQQSERVFEALGSRLEQHRREELPQAERLLLKAAHAIEHGFDTADFEADADELQVHLRELVGRSLPVLALALSDLSDTQLDYLRSRLAERLEKYRKVYAVHEPAEARLRNRALRAVELVEEWTGPLRAEQVSKVKSLRNGMPDGAGIWADYREEREARLLQLLREGADRASVERYLHDWLLDLAEAPASVVKMRADINAGLKRMVTELYPTLDEAQRVHLSSRLAKLAEHAKVLAARAPGK